MAFKSKDIKSMISHLTNPDDIAKYIAEQKKKETLKDKVKAVRLDALQSGNAIGYMRGTFEHDPTFNTKYSDEDIWAMLGGDFKYDDEE